MLCAGLCAKLEDPCQIYSVYTATGNGALQANVLRCSWRLIRSTLVLAILLNLLLHTLPQLKELPKDLHDKLETIGVAVLEVRVGNSVHGA
jgi:hypothetical protein